MAISFFDDLGRRIERSWRARDYDEAAFPDLAAEALAATPPSSAVAPEDIVRHVLSAPALEAPFGSTAGEPSVTLFRAGRFYLHALFWMSSTTAIHDHAFSGAFSVLGGSSLHTTYDWTTTRKVNDHFLLGKMTRRSVELLSAGATRRIDDGDALVHALFHLEHPSVTIVARTFSHRMRQYVYHPPGVAEDTRRPEDLRSVQLATLRVLWDSQHPDAQAATSTLLDDADLETVFHVLRAVRRSRLTVDLKAALFGHAAHRFPAEVELFRQTLSEMARRENLVRRRDAVRRPEHRFLLAMLMNLDARADVDALVAARYGGDPSDHLTRWVRELSDQPVDGALGPTALGLRMTDDERNILEAMLRGASEERILDDLAARFDDVASQRPQLERLTRKLKSHPALAPLFA
ncbi:MAG: hypothetical protein U0235_20215 [Polyangiaceae bacterium]